MMKAWSKVKMSTLQISGKGKKSKIMQAMSWLYKVHTEQWQLYGYWPNKRGLYGATKWDWVWSWWRTNVKGQAKWFYINKTNAECHMNYKQSRLHSTRNILLRELRLYASTPLPRSCIDTAMPLPIYKTYQIKYGHTTNFYAGCFNLNSFHVIVTETDTIYTPFTTFSCPLFTDLHESTSILK